MASSLHRFCIGYVTISWQVISFVYKVMDKATQTFIGARNFREQRKTSCNALRTAGILANEKVDAIAMEQALLES